MENLTLGVYLADEHGEIYSKRPIGTNWNVNIAQDLVEQHSKYVIDEISTILVENLKLQITPDVIKEMLSEVKKGIKK